MKQKPRLLDLRKHIGQVQELRAKLKLKKGLASSSTHRSGSILVYTLIVMMIMLSTALSIFAVAVREKKGAGTTAASMQAFAVADSGSEIALQAADRGTAINSLPGATSCNSTTGTVTISVAGGIADITFYSDESATTALGCGASAGSAQKVKSVGKYGGTARAVEVAVAGPGDCPGIMKTATTAMAPAGGTPLTLDCGAGCEISRCGSSTGEDSSSDAKGDAADSFFWGTGLVTDRAGYNDLGSQSATRTVSRDKWGALIIECVPTNGS